MTRVGIAAESARDLPSLQHLTDRVLRRSSSNAELEWMGPEDSAWLDLHRAQRRARARGMRRYGHFNGEPAAADAMMFYAALWLFAEESQPPSAVIVARDLDDLPERQLGFTQAATERTWPFTSIGALANPEVEAWYIVAWRPESPQDKAALAAARQRLGFDPTLYPERLSSKREQDKRDAKRALRELCATGRSAEERWADAPLEQLRQAGERCGLSGFIADLERLFPPRSQAAP